MRLISSGDDAEAVVGEAHDLGKDMFQMDPHIPLCRTEVSLSSFVGGVDAWSLERQIKLVPVTLLEVEGCSITTLTILGLNMRHVQHHGWSLGSQKTSIDHECRIVKCPGPALQKAL